MKAARPTDVLAKLLEGRKAAEVRAVGSLADGGLFFLLFMRTRLVTSDSSNR